MQERELFIKAKAIRDPLQRSEFLNSVCGGDLALHERLVRMLEADQSGSSFLNLIDESPVQDEVREKPGDRIGPYRLLETIGEGGFGVVFLAEQVQPVKRQVALKVIRPGMDSRQVIARFEAERQALAIMDHPNIAKVLDAGTTASGRPFFVMELVMGIAITRYCDEQRLDLKQRLRLFYDVCQAIGHAHSKGIIHRDIKPGNVLVARYDEKLVAKVIDFGVAKATGEPLTERTLHTGFGSIVGSLEYMSPEQASLNQLDIDTRSDVYSLGVLLYELLTGSTPIPLEELRFAGVLESLRLIREREPNRPSTRLSTAEGLPKLAANRNAEPARLTAVVKAELDWITMKALEKERSRRYDTVNALCEDIHRYLHGEPVLAHPPTTLYRWRKHLRRNRLEWTIAALVTVLMSAVSILSLHYQTQRKVAQNQHSQRVENALLEARATFQAASSATIGQKAPWTAARAAAMHLNELLALQPANASITDAARQYLDEYQAGEADRRLAEQVEDVVIKSATQSDLGSWQEMDRQFRDLFLNEGIDPERMSPAEVANRIRNHRSSQKLCDAFELWIGTKGQIGALSKNPANEEQMKPLSEAMLAADDDPVRYGIRYLLYSGKRFGKEDVDAVIGDSDLATLSPRTLSWLATMYLLAGAPEAMDRIFYFAIDRYPDDFMLSFDFAYSLESQKRWPESIRYFLRCTALRPDVAGVWRGLGNAYHRNKELSRAQEALLKASELAPHHAETKADYANVLLDLEKNQQPSVEQNQ